MSRRLKPNELICFGFSHFECEARYLIDSMHGDIVEVMITMFKGMRYRFLCNPTLTGDEIKELTAYKVLDQLKIFHTEVRDFAKQVREESCQRT